VKKGNSDMKGNRSRCVRGNQNRKIGRTINLGLVRCADCARFPCRTIEELKSESPPIATVFIYYGCECLDFVSKVA